jgi:hypothetical protein
MHGVLALVAAAEGADIGADTGAMTARLSDFTDATECPFDIFIVSSG